MIGMVKSSLFFLPFSMVVILGTGTPAFAQNVLDPLCNKAGGSSAVCRENDQTRKEDESNSSVLDIASTVLGIFSYVIGIAAVIVLFIGGVKFATSAGDSAKIGNARNTVIYAFVGLVIAILAQAIVSFVLDRL